MDPSHLIKLADTILSGASEHDLVALLGEYSEQFALWYGKNEEEIKKLTAPPSDHLVLILQQKHAEILKLADDLKGEIATDLRNLKKKGKGILAYTDVFPKRMSSIRPRKF